MRSRGGTAERREAPRIGTRPSLQRARIASTIFALMHVIPALIATWMLRSDSFEFLYILAAAVPPVVACLMLWRTAVREIVLVLNVVVAAFYGFGGTTVGILVTVVGSMFVSGPLAGKPGSIFLLPVLAYALTAIAVMWLCSRVMREDRIRP